MPRHRHTQSELSSTASCASVELLTSSDDEHTSDSVAVVAMDPYGPLRVSHDISQATEESPHRRFFNPFGPPTHQPRCMGLSLQPDDTVASCSHYKKSPMASFTQLQLRKADAIKKGSEGSSQRSYKTYYPPRAPSSTYSQSSDMYCTSLWSRFNCQSTSVTSLVSHFLNLIVNNTSTLYVQSTSQQSGIDLHTPQLQTQYGFGVPTRLERRGALRRASRNIPDGR
jgi:hypothetical protein